MNPEQGSSIEIHFVYYGSLWGRVLATTDICIVTQFTLSLTAKESQTLFSFIVWWGRGRRVHGYSYLVCECM